MDYPFKGHGPLFLLLLAFLAGVFLGLAAGSAWIALAALHLAAAILFAALGRHPYAAALSIMVLCGTLTAGRLPLADPGQVRPFLDREVVLRAVVEEARAGDSGWSGVARDALVSHLEGSRSLRLDRVLLSVRRPDRAGRFPSEVRAVGRLRAIRSRGNPGELPREWSAMAMGVQYTFSTEGSKAVFLRPEAEGERLRGLFPRIREKTGRWLDRHAGGSDGALYLRALTTGEVPPPSHPMVTLLRKTGLAHLLAISGVNVAIFFAIHSFLLRGALWVVRRRHGTPDLNRLSALLSVPVCWAYVLMAGAPVPAVRSAGMITVAVILWNGLGVRRADLAWSFLFVGTLAASPFQLFSPSFLLSYGASFFLIVSFAARAGEGARRTPACRALRWCRDALVASAVAFLGTLPVSAAFFGSFPAGAILWNLVFGPVLGTGGVMGAFTAAVGGAFGIDAFGGPVGFVAKGLTLALSALARLSGDGWGCLPLPPPGAAAALAFTAAAVWGSLSLRRRGREPWPAALAAAGGFLLFIHLPYAALPDRSLRLTALNVGNGAAHVAVFPDGRCMVVDAGSALRGDAGGRIVAPFLRKIGTGRIDVLALTHPHEDHAGGAKSLLEGFRVGEIWIPGDVPVEAFGEAVSQRASLVRRMYGGERFSAGGATVAVRSAGLPGGPSRPNEQSLVLSMRHGPVSIWMPGDVERGPAAWGPAESRAGEKRILFLPHHGSPRADPDSWLAAARPAVVISQNSNCLPLKNLLPSVEYFLLENGAFTVRYDGYAVSWEQDGAPFWRLLWRLP